MTQEVSETRPEGLPAIPRPGGIFDPVARALDVIGERWTLVLVRQLFSGPKGFQELRVRTGIAPRVLSARLRQLVAQGFVETVSERGRSLYAVTARGRSTPSSSRLPIGSSSFENASGWMRVPLPAAGTMPHITRPPRRPRLAGIGVAPAGSGSRHRIGS